MDLINGNTHTHLMCLINAVIRNAGGGGRKRSEGENRIRMKAGIEVKQGKRRNRKGIAERRVRAEGGSAIRLV